MKLFSIGVLIGIGLTALVTYTQLSNMKACAYAQGMIDGQDSFMKKHDKAVEIGVSEIIEACERVNWPL